MEDIDCNQYGNSILSNIFKSIDIINEYLMEGDNLDIIYLDFNQAFDTVSHCYLLVKWET